MFFPSFVQFDQIGENGRSFLNIVVTTFTGQKGAHSCGEQVQYKTFFDP